MCSRYLFQEERSKGERSESSGNNIFNNIYFSVSRHINDLSSLMKHGLAKSIVTTWIQYQCPVENHTPWVCNLFLFMFAPLTSGIKGAVSSSRLG